MNKAYARSPLRTTNDTEQAARIRSGVRDERLTCVVPPTLANEKRGSLSILASLTAGLFHTRVLNDYVVYIGRANQLS